MKLHLLEKRTGSGYTTFGSIWGKGEVPADSAWVLKNSAGKEIDMQSRITAWWPDGSIRWAAHTVDSASAGTDIEVIPVPSAISKKFFSEGIRIEKCNGIYRADTGRMQLEIPDILTEHTGFLAQNICLNKRLLTEKIVPVFIMEHKSQKQQNGRTSRCTEEMLSEGIITAVSLEEKGNLQCVFRFDGFYVKEEEKQKMPFIIHMYLNADSADIRFTHTFFFDGEEDKDYLKGMGIRFDAVLKGEPYDRHIRFGTDKAGFHEAAILLNSNYPRFLKRILADQMAGKHVVYDPDSDVALACKALPVWKLMV